MFDLLIYLPKRDDGCRPMKTLTKRLSKLEPSPLFIKKPPGFLQKRSELTLLKAFSLAATYLCSHVDKKKSNFIALSHKSQPTNFFLPRKNSLLKNRQKIYFYWIFGTGV